MPLDGWLTAKGQSNSEHRDRNAESLTNVPRSNPDAIRQKVTDFASFLLENITFSGGNMFYFLIIGAFTFFLFIYLARKYFLLLRIVSGSMIPTLRIGEIVLLCRIFSVRKLGKGQIVSFQIPSEQGMMFIKRIAALEGETYSFRPFPDEDNVKRCYIPRGHVFVVGDNPVSIDSRDWGPIPADSIIGVVIAIMSKEGLHKI